MKYFHLAVQLLMIPVVLFMAYKEGIFRSLFKNKNTQLTAADDIDTQSNAVDQSGIHSNLIRRVGTFDNPYRFQYPESLNKQKWVTPVKIVGQYGGNVANRDRVIYNCPRCSTLHEMDFRHGDAFECLVCSLRVQSYGNGLDVE